MKLNALNVILLATATSAISLPNKQDIQQAVLGGGPVAAGTSPKETAATSETIIPSPVPTYLEIGMRTVTRTTTVTRTKTVAMTTASVMRTVTATPTTRPTYWNWLLGSSNSDCNDDDEKMEEEEEEQTEPEVALNCFCAGGSVCCYGDFLKVKCDYGNCGVV
ncbi:hypothetical protein B0H66DRAFT_15493 [Apodospora peruviana]|uniref:Uncharacterized protein n=1 Tax=Apodospora peruviana TaxID=516989 RepID=A0AAE0IPW3_9PEZI|nr:hypothetical protein B0H66DRAFT_15493 [Apodospora peruviana]